MTALCVDIVNSTEQVRTLSSEKAGEYYQKFIDTTSGVIEKHGGHVLKNVGDGVLGFFLSGEIIVENHDNAVRCGLAILEVINKQLNPYFSKLDIPSIECRVSADFGPVKVLKLTSSAGTTMDLFGTAMNWVTKISHFAKPSQMVIGDNLFWRLIDNDGIDFRLVKRWDVRGKYTYPVYLTENK